MEELKKSLTNEKSQFNKQISTYNEEFLKLTQDIEILQNEIRRLNDEITAERQEKTHLLFEQEEKYNKVMSESKNRIKAHKEQI